MKNDQFEGELSRLKTAIKAVQLFGDQFKSSLEYVGTESDHVVDAVHFPVDQFNSYIKDISEMQALVPEMTAPQIAEFQNHLAEFKLALQSVQKDSEKLCAITAESIQKSKRYNKGASAYLKASSTG